MTEFCEIGTQNPIAADSLILIDSNLINAH